jgi:glutamyl-tRNA reductase
MSVLVVGLNHRTAPVSLLERAAVQPAELAGFLDTLLGGRHVAECAVVSTCNRVEVYAAVSSFHGGLHDVGEVLAERIGMDLAGLADHLYVHHGDDAVRHLFTVTAGLDSLVVGEAQILGQVRNSYSSAVEHGAPGRVLHELMQQSLRAGKRVHAETAIDRAGQSIVTLALDVGQRTTGSVEGRHAMIVGAGSMGALAAATLRRLRIGRLTVANRTAGNASALASTVDADVIALDAVDARLADVDILVSATATTGVVITADAVTAAQRVRGGRPLLVLDLAVPKDVDHAVARIPGVTVVDIERLRREVADATDPQTAGYTVAEDVQAAHSIVDEEVRTFLAWERSSDVAPTVAALRARADEVVATELARLSTRLGALDPGDRAEVEKSVRRVVSRLLHMPTVRVKELATTPGGHAYAEALRELFGLETAGASARAAVSVEPAIGTAVEPAAVPAVTPADVVSLLARPYEEGPR